MLREFLRLYLKRSNKRIISFLLTIGFILFIGFIINKWIIILSIIIIILSISILSYINLEIKQAKFCVILDTYNLQKIFLNEKKIAPIQRNKFTKSYKKWLLTDAIDKNINIIYLSPFHQNSYDLCLYYFFCLIPILIIGTISIIYLSIFHTWIIIFVFMVLSLVYYFFIQNKIIKDKYKILDSEIKRILFEEETGYSPINKNKLTFKYRAWLLMNER
jgi:hypothetical protein